MEELGFFALRTARLYPSSPATTSPHLDVARHPRRSFARRASIGDARGFRSNHRGSRTGGAAPNTPASRTAAISPVGAMMHRTSDEPEGPSRGLARGVGPPSQGWPGSVLVRVRRRGDVVRLDDYRHRAAGRSIDMSPSMLKSARVVAEHHQLADAAWAGFIACASSTGTYSGGQSGRIVADSHARGDASTQADLADASLSGAWYSCSHVPTTDGAEVPPPRSNRERRGRWPLGEEHPRPGRHEVATNRRARAPPPFEPLAHVLHRRRTSRGPCTSWSSTRRIDKRLFDAHRSRRWTRSASRRSRRSPILRSDHNDPARCAGASQLNTVCLRRRCKSTSGYSHTCPPRMTRSHPAPNRDPEPRH